MYKSNGKKEYAREKDNERTNWNKCEYHKSVANVLLCTYRDYRIVHIGTLQKSKKKKIGKEKLFYIHFIFLYFLFALAINSYNMLFII